MPNTMRTVARKEALFLPFRVMRVQCSARVTLKGKGRALYVVIFRGGVWLSIDFTVASERSSCLFLPVVVYFRFFTLFYSFFVYVVVF